MSWEGPFSEKLLVFTWHFQTCLKYLSEGAQGIGRSLLDVIPSTSNPVQIGLSKKGIFFFLAQGTEKVSLAGSKDSRI